MSYYHQSRPPSRINRLRHALSFSKRHTLSLRDCWRFLYLSEFKPSLVFRGWTRYRPEQKHQFRIKVSDGRAFDICVRDNGLDISTITEFFSPHTIVFPRHLRPFQPKVIYDIGANIGIASLYFAAAFPNARIYGFEPMPSNYEICKLNYRNVSQGEAFPWAVGARTEFATFEFSNDPRGGRLQGCTSAPQLQAEGKITVEVFSLADLVESKGLPAPDFLKIDVEGAELEVLKGLENHLGNVKRIFLETHGPELKTSCLKWLTDRSFHLIDSEDDTAIWAERF